MARLVVSCLLMVRICGRGGERTDIIVVDVGKNVVGQLDEESAQKETQLVVVHRVAAVVVDEDAHHRLHDGSVVVLQQRVEVGDVGGEERLGVRGSNRVHVHFLASGVREFSVISRRTVCSQRILHQILQQSIEVSFLRNNGGDGLLTSYK